MLGRRKLRRAVVGRGDYVTSGRGGRTLLAVVVLGLGDEIMR